MQIENVYVPGLKTLQHIHQEEKNIGKIIRTVQAQRRGFNWLENGNLKMTILICSNSDPLDEWARSDHHCFTLWWNISGYTVINLFL